MVAACVITVPLGISTDERARCNFFLTSGIKQIDGGGGGPRPSTAGDDTPSSRGTTAKPPSSREQEWKMKRETGARRGGRGGVRQNE